MNYVLHPPESGPSTRDYLLEGEEFWSTDFATLDEFLSTVESSEDYRTASSRDVMAVAFYSQEEGDQDEPDDE